MQKYIRWDTYQMIYSVFRNPAPIDLINVNKLVRIEKRSWYLLIMMDLVPSLPRSARVRIRRSRLATYHQKTTFAFVIIIIGIIEKNHGYEIRLGSVRFWFI